MAVLRDNLDTHYHWVSKDLVKMQEVLGRTVQSLCISTASWRILSFMFAGLKTITILLLYTCKRLFGYMICDTAHQYCDFWSGGWNESGLALLYLQILVPLLIKKEKTPQPLPALYQHTLLCLCPPCLHSQMIQRNDDCYAI